MGKLGDLTGEAELCSGALAGAGSRRRPRNQRQEKPDWETETEMGKKTKKRASPPRPRGSGSVPGELTAVHMWFPPDWEVEGLPLRGGLCTQRGTALGAQPCPGEGWGLGLGVTRLCLLFAGVPSACKQVVSVETTRDIEWATYTCTLGFHVFGEFATDFTGSNKRVSPFKICLQ